MREILSEWGWFVGIILSTITFCGIVTKFLKANLSTIIDNANAPQNEDIKAIKENLEKVENTVNSLEARSDASNIAMQAALRSTITNIYFKYKDQDTIPYYEKENLDKLYHAYRGIGGNSFVEDLYNTLSKKQIK